jgi:hypothetical protein
VARDDFLKFLELFFNREMWCGMRWCDMLLEFSELFCDRKGNVPWDYFLDFLKLFFNWESWHGMLLEFLEIFLMEKDDMAWDDVTYLHVKRIEISDL